MGVIALDLIDAQLYPLLYEHLDDRALHRGATSYSLLARHFNDWFATERKWLTALVKAWTNDPQHAEANRKVLGLSADRWYPRACDAVNTFAAGLAESAGSTTVMAAAARGAAELAAELSKAGIPTSATEGAAS